MCNTNIFIEKYKQLEAIIRSTYHLTTSDSVVYYLEKQNRFRAFKEEISYCREVRNLLSHREKIDDDFAVEPSTSMIEFLDKLIEQVKSRTKCRTIAIGISNVFWQDINGNVKAAMKTMQQKLFTHVPILQDGIVTGVLDENSIFNYLAKEEIIDIDDHLTFQDIRPFLSLDNREMEQFIFIEKNCYVDELEEKIEQAFLKNKRIGLAFITENGKPTQKLQGIITPWDIISSKTYQLQ